jgi:hypothetical protein
VSLWAPRPEQTPPRQPYPARASGTSLLTAASRHLARGDSAGLCGGFAALAAIHLLGFLVAASRDAKIERLRAVYKTGQITYTQLYALSSAAKSPPKRPHTGQEPSSTRLKPSHPTIKKERQMPRVICGVTRFTSPSRAALATKPPAPEESTNEPRHGCATSDLLQNPAKATPKI